MSESIDFWASMSAEARSALQIAEAECRALGAEEISVEHLMLGLCAVASPDLEAAMNAARVQGSRVGATLRSSLAAAASSEAPKGVPGRRPGIAARLNHVCGLAFDRADAMGDLEIRPVHLLLALLDDQNSLAATQLQTAGLSSGLRAALEQRLERRARRLQQSGGGSDTSLREGWNDEEEGSQGSRHGSARHGEPSGATPAATASPTQGSQGDASEASSSKPSQQTESPLAAYQGGGRSRGYHLARYGHDLSLAARQGALAPVVGRDDLVLQVLRILSRETKANPMLLGPAGVGKTAIVEALAQLSVAPQPPQGLVGKRIVALTMTSLLSGATYRGQLEERVQGLLRDLLHAPEVILFIDEVHTLIGAGRTINSAMDVADAFKPALSRGQIRCIGATTEEEYNRYICGDAALDRRFEPVLVPEPGLDQVLTILQGRRPRLEAHHGVVITDASLTAALRLAQVYLADRRFPDKALDLLDAAASLVTTPSLEPARVPKDSVAEAEEPVAGAEESVAEALPASTLLVVPSHVLPEHVAQAVAVRTGLPVERLVYTDERGLGPLSTLASTLMQRVLGQNQAITALVESLTARRILRRDARPLGSFLLVGPPGVGKTELARALAEGLFGSEQALLCFEGTNFGDHGAVARLVGASPGLVGYSEGGQLTGAVRRHSHRVILFDQIEAMHPEALALVGQILERGQLTDASGLVVDFCQAVVVLTAHVQNLEPMPGYLLHRVDEVLMLRSLGAEALEALLDKELRVLEHDLEAWKVGLEVTDAARALLVQEGTSLVQGARRLLGEVERQLRRPLARLIALRSDPCRVKVDVHEQMVVLKVSEAASETSTLYKHQASILLPPQDSAVPDEASDASQGSPTRNKEGEA